MPQLNAHSEKTLTHIYVRDAQKAFLRPCWRSGNDVYCGMCMRWKIQPVVGTVCKICSSTVERVLEVVSGGATQPLRERQSSLIRTSAQKVQGRDRGLVLDFLDSRRAGT